MNQTVLVELADAIEAYRKTRRAMECQPLGARLQAWLGGAMRWLVGVLQRAWAMACRVTALRRRILDGHDSPWGLLLQGLGSVLDNPSGGAAAILAALSVVAQRLVMHGAKLLAGRTPVELLQGLHSWGMQFVQ